jgi:hypothetical protein
MGQRGSISIRDQGRWRCYFHLRKDQLSESFERIKKIGSKIPAFEQVKSRMLDESLGRADALPPLTFGFSGF